MKSRRERFIGEQLQQQEQEQQITESELVSSPGAFEDDDIQEIVEETFDQFYDSKSALDTLGGARRVVNAVAANETRRQEIVEDEFIRTHFIGNNERAQVTFIAAEAGLDFEDINTYDGLFDVESNRQAIADEGAVTLIRQVESLRKVVPEYVDFETDLPWEVVDVHATGGDELECFYFEPTGEFVVSHRFTNTGTSEIEFESVGSQEAIDVMAVGGGGSGGAGNNERAMGAGAGGLVDTTRDGGGSLGTIDETTYDVSVGAGSNSTGTGGDSEFGGMLTADGGGSGETNNNTTGTSGGCGAGSTTNSTTVRAGGASNQNEYGFGSGGGAARESNANNTQGAGAGGGVLTAGRPGSDGRTPRGGAGMYVGHYAIGVGERGYVGGGGAGAASEDNGNTSMDGGVYSESPGYPKGGIGGGGDGQMVSDTNNNAYDNADFDYNEWPSAENSQPQSGLDGAGGGGGAGADSQSIGSNPSSGGDGQVIVRLAAPAGKAVNIPYDPKDAVPEDFTIPTDLPADWDDWKRQYA